MNASDLLLNLCAPHPLVHSGVSGSGSRSGSGSGSGSDYSSSGSSSGSSSDYSSSGSSVSIEGNLVDVGGGTYLVTRGVLVGFAVGGFGGGAIIATITFLLVFCCCCRRRWKVRDVEENNDSTNY